MSHREAFAQIMNTTEQMALATSVADMPNVRVVTFVYDAGHPGRVYFTTFRGNRKTEEFARNERVAILPLSVPMDATAQVRIFGKVRKADRSLAEIGKLIAEKTPSFADTLAQAGPMLEAYEIAFDKAAVTIGMEDAVILEI